uniref:Uncharacterized protein n=1 Tax=Siphoviridae sp. ctQqU1 TaxID=2825496 RepID=A0A8S5Q3J6_9CAUD|nr:MAG TPA: hypothetical protein [Siphoviridae sp. ctQqU1]DAI21365.1 MAG TPA: hypothetical protein [Caudoviricetes sp.]
MTSVLHQQKAKDNERTTKDKKILAKPCLKLD